MASPVRRDPRRSRKACPASRTLPGQPAPLDRVRRRPLALSNGGTARSGPRPRPAARPGLVLRAPAVPLHRSGVRRRPVPRAFCDAPLPPLPPSWMSGTSGAGLSTAAPAFIRQGAAVGKPAVRSRVLLGPPPGPRPAAAPPSVLGAARRRPDGCASCRHRERLLMASYHLQVKTIKRSAGRSATAAAAYRSGEAILCQREGRLHDYSRKGGIEETFLVLPERCPRLGGRPAQLWNEAEARETRRNSVTAREWELALPAELPAAERRALAHDFARGARRALRHRGRRGDPRAASRRRRAQPPRPHPDHDPAARGGRSHRQDPRARRRPDRRPGDRGDAGDLGGDAERRARAGGGARPRRPSLAGGPAGGCAGGRQRAPGGDHSTGRRR